MNGKMDTIIKNLKKKENFAVVDSPRTALLD